MQDGNFVIESDGKEIDDIYADIDTLEVVLDEELAAMFKLRINLILQSDGAWKWLDDERLALWKKVTVLAGYEQTLDKIFTGYITHVMPRFEECISKSTLEIWALDESVRMDREEILKAWPGKKDSDIVQEIFQTYGFSPEIEDTTVVHEETVSTIVQRETDMQFLRRLAARNGFECFVENGTGFFRAPIIDADPQPTLAVHFEKETNVHSFFIQTDALMPSRFAMFQLGRMDKEIIEASAETSEQKILGEKDGEGMLSADIEPSISYVGNNGTTGMEEMSLICRSLVHDRQWFVFGEGEINSEKYEHVLYPRRPVTIKGVGETYSGIYWVTQVTHMFTPCSYIQKFRVKRNGMMPTGDEPFEGGGGLLGGLL